MDKWTYEVNLNSDIWNGEIFDTKEEAIEEGRKLLNIKKIALRLE